jgi:diazepam-binding inhibitor (GABA receptor modulator, acyl-CoA-binding protein)
MKFAVIGGVGVLLLLLIAVSVVSLNNPELLAKTPLYGPLLKIQETLGKPVTPKTEGDKLAKSEGDKPAAPDAAALDAEFEKAKEVWDLFRNKLSHEEGLDLYSLFKQATIGDVNTTSPPWFKRCNGLACIRLDHWGALKGMNTTAAKEKYVKLAKELITKYEDQKPVEPAKKDEPKNETKKEQ